MPSNALEVLLWDANGNKALDFVLPFSGGAPTPQPAPPPAPGPSPTPTPSGSPPAWPSYTGTSQLVGTSPSGRVTVWVDPVLGAAAMTNAQDLLADADRIVGLNNALFETPGGPVNVIVFALGGATDGTGGADHMACDYTNGAAIEVDASFGNSARVSALFEAELSECSMNGNLCGESTGEALSRWCAMAIAGNVLSDFASAPTWDQGGRPNWVDTTENTDQGYDSIGCGMAFLSWLQSIGQPLSKIAQAMVAQGDGGTLAEVYATLTGKPLTSAWVNFTAALIGVSITDDDPFHVLPTTPPMLRRVCESKSHRLKR